MKSIPELKKQHNGWTLQVDGKPFVMLSGEVHNSSASSLAYMEKEVWPAVMTLNCNSLIVPIYWELFEPEEGVFDTSLLDGIVAQARERNIRLVLLWFASWKNSYSTYVPGWVKSDVKRFPRMENANGELGPRISYLCEEAKQLDARAFTKMMSRLKEIDEAHNTVIMVQVQNEVGILGADRDYSAVAEKEFNSTVPEKLVVELRNRYSSLRPELLKTLSLPDDGENKIWSEVFGDLAEEVFSAWHFAIYMEAVAASGQAVYNLPLFINAWLVQGEGEPAGKYPSGGPVTRMIDIWQIGAPTFVLTAPDIYLDDFAGICDDYHRPDNPLLIPEARRDETASSNLFYSVGRHHTLCFAPFGIESMVSNVETVIAGNEVADASHNITNNDFGEKLSKSYKLLDGMMPLITEFYGTENLTGILQSAGIKKEFISFGGYRFEIEYSEVFSKGGTPGAGLLIHKGDSEFYFAGHGFMVTPLHKEDSKNEKVEVLSLDEGLFVDGVWERGRRLNGDECRCILPADPEIRRLELVTIS